MQVLAHLPADHLPQAHLNVNAFVVKARVELVRVFLASIVKVQAQVGVDSDAKVVVHDKDLRIVLALSTHN